ncbi:TrbC family F-type conjugative pilus assembly protein [Rickettsiaceae bacterium]|nr:TrbC family F-type conjugative pilus assembly protein [Rickettsiaceae bacterium]
MGGKKENKSKIKNKNKNKENKENKENKKEYKKMQNIMKLTRKALAVFACITTLFCMQNTYANQNIRNLQNPEIQIEDGIYVFVSFSMNDASLHSYFKEAQKHKAKLIMNGLVKEDDGSNNRFANTKAKMERAKINVEIDPNLFELLSVKEVPTIAVVEKGSVKKIKGHIEIRKALEIIGKREGKKEVWS